jgi:hypothetical protein
MALKDLYTDEEIKNAAGIDILEFKKTVISIQDTVAQKVTATCPNITVDLNPYLSKLSGNDI